MSIATLVFPHQLYKNHPAIARDRKIILIEEFLYFSHYHFHKQKLVLHRGAMKAYKALLQKGNPEIIYIESAEKYSDVRQMGKWLKKQKVAEVHYAELSDDWLHRRLKKSLEDNGIAAVIYPTPNFITTPRDADAYFDTKKSYFQTDFYIWQRRRLNILLEKDGKPTGGKWSFDDENRKPFPKGEEVPELHFPRQNQYIKEAIEYVEKNWPDNYGNLRNFRYPVTHLQAEKWLDDFLENRFKKFGVYEDAMVAGEHYLYHSVLTPMLNIGLLDPNQIIDAAIKAAEANDIPLNSTEGFIRQILGWREFIHAVYRREGRKQRTKNYWAFHRPVPHSFWTGETGIVPVDTVIKKVLETGYSHHIERLMIMGNFMLLCEFDPDDVYRWFMEMYIDAYDWVMVPNTYGMTQFSDGGLMMTKPYISGSNYLLKMGNWKKGNKNNDELSKELGQMPFSFEEGVGVRASGTKNNAPEVHTESVPWNEIWDGLFWRFMHVHQDFFKQNPRLALLLGSFNKMDKTKRNNHLKTAEAFLKKLDKENEEDAKDE